MSFEISNNQEDIQKDFLRKTTYNSVDFFNLRGLRVWAKVVKTWDGDTSTMVFFVNNKPMKFRCRLSSVDCAEKTSDDVYERRHAQRAVRRFEEWHQDELVFIECNGWDKYHRVLVDVYRAPEDESSFNELMLGEGLAYPYEGGTRRPFRQWALLRFYSGNDVSPSKIDNIQDDEVLNQ